MLHAIGFVVRDVRVERVRERSGVNDNYAEHSGYDRGERAIGHNDGRNLSHSCERHVRRRP
jgi:hypothetical protein